MNPFTTRYNALSNPDLLKIIDNRNDYQPLAVEAAKIELTGRQLSDEELETANAENAVEAQKKQLRNDEKTAFENKAKDIRSSIIDAVHPVQKTPPSANRIIIILSIVFGILFLIEAFNQLGLIKFILTNKAAKWSIEGIFYFLPLFLIPTATFLFWRRKKSGWILFCIFFTFSALSATVSFLMELKRNARNTGNTAIDNLLPAVSPVSFLWNMFFFGGCLWLICKNDIREIYVIDKRTMFITQGIGVVVTVITICWLLT